MRFYLVYFSVLVPLIFAVLNYSLGQLAPTQTSTNTTMNAITTTMPIEQQTNIENRHITVTKFMNSTNRNSGKLIRQNSSLTRKQDCSNEQFELQSPLMANIMQDNDGVDEHEQFLASPSSSSQSSTIPVIRTDIQHHRPPITGKQKYFSNNLYEKCSRNMLIR
jgi:hypothetical protein